MDLNTVDKLLTTTRTVRKRLDLTRAVEPDVIRECLSLAIQAPSGSNRQGWHFMVVTDAAKRAAIADYYRRSFNQYIGPRREQLDDADASDDAPQPTAVRVAQSAIHLADHMHEVPVHIIACIDGRPGLSRPMEQAGLYGSILPAAWSLMLALRSRGLGSAWTTLHLRYEAEVAALLGIPDDVTQAALLPVAYYTGDDFKPARRRPAREITYWDSWGATT